MLICYNGEVKEVEQRNSGCSACKQSAGTKRTLKRVREADYYLSNGQMIHFVQGRPVQIQDEDGLELLDLAYTFDGKIYDKFTVVTQ